MKVKELNHVAIRTGNIDATVAFFTDILDARIIRDFYNAEGNRQFVYVQLAEGVIEIIRGKEGASNLGLQHVAFLVEDLDAAYEELSTMGMEFTVLPKTASSGDGRLAFFKEPSGCLFELIQREENIRIPGLKNKYIEEFDHISIRVTDDNKERAQDFYQEKMGMTLRAHFGKTGSTMDYYRLGPDTLESLYRSGMTQLEQPLVHIALRVKDDYAMKEYLESKGVACPEPKESGVGGFHVMNVIGPEGVTIEFVDRCEMEKFVPPVKE